ncbi:extracellular solute-binding protein family 5 [Catenulispora acidiphila DSM 44928]|uniref:Extracellular solute-binding protein family 5 n=1 Tax=Catenulispora acidiphila (strain DSM 44928 / JCM 14897 / NBRC 102108 / NRRL B-24433 / ID139908) TaxID=479433 RepID=C7Q6W4_CATAD|nr:ABC transporter substrate-binding protein [Catenulispora acidiphila]ACU75977.1 extracellular solute-binding protein family 5 [Catenulispora acidiphila DSM 44928]
MSASRRRSRSAIAVTVLATLTITAGCSSSSAKKSGSGQQEAAQNVAKQAVAVGTAADSRGPDPAVSGAKSGGTVTVLEHSDFSHLDPARVWSSTNQTADLLLTRQLTSYQQVGNTTKLVGDLATDTGSSTDGKTWTYHLKAGLKYEDGSTITAQDVKYGIERTFQKELSGGPQYLQMWLTGKTDYSSTYSGPWGGQDLPQIQTPDATTIVFHLASVHADFPFALAMQAYSPLPKDKDAKSALDQHPFSSGPYKVDSHDIDKGMVLSRNTHWDANTDPVRHAYPDQWKFEFGAQDVDINQRLAAANGADKDAMTFKVTIGSDLASQVNSSPDLKARLVNQVTPFSEFYNINTRRVTDVKVREALLEAFPRAQTRQLLGGPIYGDFTTTILSPVTNGYQDYDLYGAPDTGDPAKAKALLATTSTPHPTIVYAYQDDTAWQQGAVAIQQALTKAGFTVVTKAISDKNYYDETQKTDNQFDVYWGGWGPDWPSASSVIPPLFDGRQITDGGSDNSLLNDPTVNAEIDRIQSMTDLSQQNTAWAALDKKIMQEVPIIPWVDPRQVSLYGPGLGGVHTGFIGTCYPLDVYVK